MNTKEQEQLYQHSTDHTHTHTSKLKEHEITRC